MSKFWGPLHPAFDKLFEPADAERPAVSGLIAALKVPGGALWEQGVRMYKRGCGRDIDEAGIRQFTAACPPFHALLLSLGVAQFNWCIRDTRARSIYRAGRLDLFSAVYLPFCDRYVTNDSGQYEALRVVAQEANLDVEVSRYAEFRRAFLIGAGAAQRP